MNPFGGIVALCAGELTEDTVLSYLKISSLVDGPLSRSMRVESNLCAIQQDFVDDNQDSHQLNLLLKKNRYLIIGSVELTNRAELCRQLQINKAVAEVVSDVHLVLLTYLKWSKDCVNYFLGSFSFVIWDFKKQQLFGAVDHLGIKRLFYRVVGATHFCFSSTLKSLVHSHNSRLDQENTLCYLFKLYQPREKTPYAEILTVPSGSCIEVRGGEVVVSKYWNPTVNYEKIGRSWEEGAEQRLRELIYRVIEDNISVRRSYGVLLSGGLDSSAIACIAQRILQLSGQKVMAFSKILPQGNSLSVEDEREYINAIVEQEKLRVSFVTEIRNNTDVLMHEYYESRYCFPLNPFPFQTRLLVERAAESECSVLLSGYGGDETVSTFGLTTLSLLCKQGLWADFFQNIMRFTQANTISYHKAVRGYVLPGLLPERLKNVYRLLRGRANKPSLENRFVKQDILNDSNVKKYLDRGEGYFPDTLVDPREQLVSRINNNYFRPMLELDDYYRDILGVQQIHPFLDKRIVEFMLAIHPREFLKDGYPRSVFKRALVGILPEQVRQRQDKTPFNIGYPFYTCLLESDSFIEKTLQKSSSTIWTLIDRELLLQHYNDINNTNNINSFDDKNRLALEIGRCVNVAAFYQWNGV